MTSPSPGVGRPSRRTDGASRRRVRAAGAPLLHVALDAGDERPLYRQLYDGLREGILDGRLAPGARLPSTRALAADLGLARTTVALAFDQLRVEGYVVGCRGGGTRVRECVPDRLLDVARATSARRRGSSGASAPTPAEPPAESSPEPAPPRPAPVSARGALLVTAGVGITSIVGTEAVPFRLGLPALDAFPARTWARLTARRWRAGDVRLGEADPGGERALREAIASYVTTARGARCHAEQVIVVSGTQHALDLSARVLLDVGDAVWVEDPGYNGAHAALAAAGARLVPVPVDGEGLDVAAGERLAPDARLAYVTPSHQFPLGAVLSAPRRLALLAWARRARAWIFEDDYDSEFRYAGRPLPCLQGLEAECTRRDARVLYVGTFNKTLVPGLRLGYLVVPHALVDAMRAARAAMDRHPPTLAQGVLADFLGEGHYARQLRRVRALYAERQQALLDAAARELDGLLALAPDCAGLHLVGWLPAGVRDVDAAAAAAAHGVEVSPLSRYAVSPRPATAPGALLLSYAGFDARALGRGVRRLRGALAPLVRA